MDDLAYHELATIKYQINQRAWMLGVGTACFILSLVTIYISHESTITVTSTTNALLLTFLLCNNKNNILPLIMIGILSTFLSMYCMNQNILFSLGSTLNNIIQLIPPLLFIYIIAPLPFDFQKNNYQLLMLSISVVFGCVLSGIAMSEMMIYAHLPNDYWRAVSITFSISLQAMLSIVPVGLIVFSKKAEEIKVLLKSKEFISLICLTIPMTVISLYFLYPPFILIMLALIVMACLFDIINIAIMNLLCCLEFSVLLYSGALQNAAGIRLINEYGHLSMSIVMMVGLIISLLVTQRITYEKKLKESEERWKFALESGGQGVWDWNPSLKKAYFSITWKNMLGYDEHEISDRVDEWLSRIHPVDGERALSEIESYLKDEIEEYCSEHRLLCKNGQYIWVLTRGRIIHKSTNGAPLRLIGTHTDISQIKYAEEMSKHLQEQLQYQATHDSLTGLLNRRQFEIELKKLISSSQINSETPENQLWHALCYIDLDRFKLINDTAGHIAGDAVLSQISAVLKENIGKNDMLARIGGDEFALVIPYSPMETSILTAENIVRKISQHNFIWEGKKYDVKLSIGIIHFKPQTENIGDLMSKADVACYAAKYEGGNMVYTYNTNNSLASHYHEEIHIISGIKDSLENGKFCLYAHKIMPLKSQNKSKSFYEILIRLIDKNGNLVMPSKFIPAAERHNLMSDIDEWVIKKMLLEYGPLIAKLPHFSFSINLSGNSLNAPNFLSFLQRALDDSPIPNENICFELTETSVMNHLEKTSEFIRVIQDKGCFVALDDFGSGLSSFNYLKYFPVKYIKIDGSFIKNIEDNSIDLAITESINQLAHKLGAKTIAEFVENKNIIEILRELDVDYVQGNAIDKAVPLHELLDVEEKVKS